MLFATIISRLFEPFVLLLIIIVMALIRGGTVGIPLIQTLAVVFFGMIIPPVIALLIALRTKKISNWDMSNRKQRVRACLVFFLFMIIDFFLIRMLAIPALSQLFLFLFFVFIGFFLITLFWKISGHMLVATIAVCIWIHWFGLATTWYLLGILPLLGWSRLVLKRHTLAQIIGGVVYGVFMVWLLILT